VTPQPDDTIRRTAWALSIAGFLPFAALAMGSVLMDDAPLAQFALERFKTYGAVILSFLGGIRWGLALLNGEAHWRSLLFSVVPSLVGWFALLLPDVWCVAVMAAVFLMQGIWDGIYINRGHAPPWFAPLRVTLTVLVVTAHLFVFYGIVFQHAI